MFLFQRRDDVHKHVQPRLIGLLQPFKQVARKDYAFLQLIIPGISAISLVGFSKDALYSIDDFEEVISLIADGPLRLLLHYLLVDDLQRELQIIYDVIRHYQIERHILVHPFDFLCYPFMQRTNSVAL